MSHKATRVKTIYIYVVSNICQLMYFKPCFHVMIPLHHITDVREIYSHLTLLILFILKNKYPTFYNTRVLLGIRCLWRNLINKSLMKWPNTDDNFII